jgi:acetyl esterase/lipase
LAALVGTLSGNESFLAHSSVQKTLRSQVCLVIDYSGPTDFQYIGEKLEQSFIYRIVTSAFGNTTYAQNASLWIEASPATYISKNAAPFIIVQGNNDVMVPIGIAESFNTKLQAAGVETYFIKTEGDHEVLDNISENLVARYQLDPLLKSVFNLNLPAG